MSTKLCLFCKHFQLNMGMSYDYSEVTIGDPTEIQCKLGKWEMDDDMSETTFRSYIIQAETCVDYEHHESIEDKN